MRGNATGHWRHTGLTVRELPTTPSSRTAPARSAARREHVARPAARAGCRCCGRSGERVERAFLVEVDETDAAPGGIGERDHRAQQPRAEALALQRGVDGVEVRAQSGMPSGSSGGPAHLQPREAVLVVVRPHVRRVAAPSRSATMSRVWWKPHRSPPEADRAVAGRRESGSGLQRDRGARHQEERVQVGALRPAPPGDRLQETHALRPALQADGRLSSAWISASCSSRCSSEGCVDVSVLSDTPLMAGAMQKRWRRRPGAGRAAGSG